MRVVRQCLPERQCRESIDKMQAINSQQARSADNESSTYNHICV